MAFSRLSILILSCKTISLICLLISIHPYHWLQLENSSVDGQLTHDLCISYGAFCRTEDPMPLPRLVLVLPCILSLIGLLLEFTNLCLLHSIWQRGRSMLNYFLEQTCIALALATTIHCTWVSAVHIRISVDINVIHLHWTFFVFGFATILFAIDCMSSIARIINNCQYEQARQAKHSIQLYSCQRKSMIDSDL